MKSMTGLKKDQWLIKLTWLIKKKEHDHILPSRYKKDITTDPKDIRRIRREFKRSNSNKFKNFDETKVFLERQIHQNYSI